MRVRLASGAAVIAVAAMMPLPAAAAEKEPPTVAVSVSVNQFDASVTYSVNRKASAVTSQVCTLVNLDTSDATPTPCDPTADKRSSAVLSRYSVTVRVTDAGNYAFRVRATVSGSASPVVGSSNFTIAPGPAVRFSVAGLVDQVVLSGSGAIPDQLFTVEALDEYGNRATGYAGTVRFSGGDYSWAGTPNPESLPADSTLTAGLGVFRMNMGSIQDDCSYGDIPRPACDDYERVTATDTVNPAISGYQRFYTAIVFRQGNRYYTPDAGVCDTCVVYGPNSIQIDTSKPVTATVYSVDNSGVRLQITGSTRNAGETFIQNVDTFPMVSTSGQLSGALVSPSVGQSIVVDLAVTGDPYGDLGFASVTTKSPYGTTDVTPAKAYLNTIYAPICSQFGVIGGECMTG